ncbi:secreted PhoX family phosphatase [Methylopila capsulata]|uniref:Secreted PhoX family phosphatase n=1 Tax=Methylopila capsulata TaxID=61654 RepID=A0A9W6MTM6_9HYPH|nr:PhoX family phosphatase [Methylopila capsulata]MBM7853290.1 secreted PhoX family phosphatase [Methylopila capsulata]GLK57494.1 dTDP-glucose 4,6-dehydratase [Methylopila capsulata]
MTDDLRTTRAVACEEAENVGRNDSANPTLGEIIAARFSRREMMRGALAATAIAATISPRAFDAAGAAWAAEPASRFDFEEIEAGIDETHHVADGYDADVLLRWGDPLFPGAPAFDPLTQTAEKQRLQFGYNNDFVGFVPLDGSADRGLLVVNHEYTNEELMFPGLRRQDSKQAAFAGMTRELVDIEMAAHGGSVVEIARAGGKWSVVADSRYTRRITAETEMAIHGPAAGHERLRTSYDTEGRSVRGMINNCAGGVTPWGTWLTCEENTNNYFWGEVADDHREAKNYKRIGITGSPWQAWGRFHERFDVTKEPNEPNRFGWVVEIDPMDPASTPKKRTAMGRFKHEGAANALSADGRFVVYQGDDERFDYVYRFVTTAKVDMANRANNADILDDGVLHVARFDADGRGRWMRLVQGEGPLTPANGFASQADVVIEARRAADLLGATKMDRPEDVEANPKTGKVYVMLTNNSKRKADQVDAANPRPENAFGHIVEISPDGGDHAAEGFAWEILVKCGDPSIAAVGATFSSATSANGWFGMPDNCAVDAQGRLWIATDGNGPKSTSRADGLWALETEGAGRGASKHFFRVPAGAEMCGPYFTADDTTLFLAVQHPGESDDDKAPGTFEAPATRWPDFKPGMPPRPAVVVVTKRGGGAIA